MPLFREGKSRMYVSRWLVILLLSSVLDSGGPSTLPLPSHSMSSQSPLDVSTPAGSLEQEQCPLVISPSQLVVRFGDTLSANCSSPGQEFSYLGWEVPPAEPSMAMARFLVWRVNSITVWSLVPQCHAMYDPGGYCLTTLDVTVYKPPDSVSISYVDHSGPLHEGHQYTLQCLIQDVAPVKNITVTFYRGNAVLGSTQSSNNPSKEPVTETFTVNLNSSRADEGVQYWCEAKLDLGPHGPQPPPMMRSQKLNTTVYYGPLCLCPKALQVREGEALVWEVRGNPQPVVTWLKNGTVVSPPSHPSREHAGKYTISAEGALGWLNCTLKVDVLRAKGTAYCGHFLVTILSIQLVYLM